MAKTTITYQYWKLVKTCQEDGCPEEYNCSLPGFTGEIVGEEEVTWCFKQEEEPLQECDGCQCTWEKVQDEYGNWYWGNPSSCQPSGSGQRCLNCACAPPPYDPLEVEGSTYTSQCIPNCTGCGCAWVWTSFPTYPYYDWVLDPVCQDLRNRGHRCDTCVCDAGSKPTGRGRYIGERKTRQCRLPWDSSLIDCQSCSCKRAYNAATGVWDILTDCTKRYGTSQCIDCECPEINRTPTSYGEIVDIACLPIEEEPTDCDDCTSSWYSTNEDGTWEWVLIDECRNGESGDPCPDCLPYPPLDDPEDFPGETKPGLCVPTCQGCRCRWDPTTGILLTGCSSNTSSCSGCICSPEYYVNNTGQIKLREYTDCYPELPEDRSYCNVCSCEYEYSNGEWTLKHGCQNSEGSSCNECICGSAPSSPPGPGDPTTISIPCVFPCTSCKCKWVWLGWSWRVLSDCTPCRNADCYCASMPGYTGTVVGEVYQSDCIFGGPAPTDSCTNCTCISIWDTATKSWVQSGCSYGGKSCGENCICPDPGSYTGSNVVIENCMKMPCSSCTCEYTYTNIDESTVGWVLTRTCADSSSDCSLCFCDDIPELTTNPSLGDKIEVQCIYRGLIQDCNGCSCTWRYSDGNWTMEHGCSRNEGGCPEICKCPQPTSNGNEGQTVTVACVPSGGPNCSGCACLWFWNSSEKDWSLVELCSQNGVACPSYCGGCWKPTTRGSQHGELQQTNCSPTFGGCNCIGKYVDGVWTVISPCYNSPTDPIYCIFQVCSDPGIIEPDPYETLNATYAGVCSSSLTNCTGCECRWQCDYFYTDPENPFVGEIQFYWRKVYPCYQPGSGRCPVECACAEPDPSQCISLKHVGKQDTTDCKRPTTGGRCKCRLSWDDDLKQWNTIRPCYRYGDPPECKKLDCPVPPSPESPREYEIDVECIPAKKPPPTREDCKNCSCIWQWDSSANDWVEYEPCYKDPERRVRCPEDPDCTCNKPPIPYPRPTDGTQMTMPCGESTGGECCCAES